MAESDSNSDSEEQNLLDAKEKERQELLLQMEEVTAKIKQKIAVLLAHPDVPEAFKSELERIEGEIK